MCNTLEIAGVDRGLSSNFTLEIARTFEITGTRENASAPLLRIEPRSTTQSREVTAKSREV